MIHLAARLCSRAALPNFTPVEGGGVFFVNRRADLSHYLTVVGKARWPPMRVNRKVMVSGSVIIEHGRPFDRPPPLSVTLTC